MKEVFICAAKRSAIGSFMGSLKEMPATEMGARVLKEMLSAAAVPAEKVEEVIVGNVLQAGQGMNPARQVALKAGISPESTAFSLNRVCGSGLQAVVSAVQQIRLGDFDLVVAGGIENMSRAPHLLMKSRMGYRLGHDSLVDSLILDGLWDAFHDMHMALTVEKLAEKRSISREKQDRFAFESQMKAARALERGYFQAEITPLSLPEKKGEAILFQVDEYPRVDTTLEKLAQLRPAFKKEGTITAGNASGINDGAAFLLLASEKSVKELGLQPRARVVSYAVAGVEPMDMGLAPVAAVRKALGRAGVGLDEIDIIELNEAFAAQALAVLQELEFPPERVNPNGGAIALGHPIGASGARILVTLLYELESGRKEKGLAALCIGGGQGIAMVIERT